MTDPIHRAGDPVSSEKEPGGPPAPDIDAEDDELAGVEAFAPMTEEELAAEERVGGALAAATRRRLLTVAGTVAVVLAVVVGGARLLSALDDDDDPMGGLVFEEVPEEGGEPVDAGPPVAEPALVAQLRRVVVVAEGDGPAQDRIVTRPDPSILPVQPRDLAATVFSLDGVGQVMVAGPEGWLGDACLRASVVSSSLRAFDSVWFENVEGACDGVAIGHPVEPTCAGATAVVLPLRIPSGTVALEEGGEAGADAVRVSVATTADGYEEVSVRGTISVPDDSDVRIPAFSAEPGTAIEVPLGEPGGGITATCTMAR